MASRNNLAYDISVYEPVRKKQTQPQIKYKKNTHEVKSFSAAKSIFTALAAMIILCCMLYGKVETTKLYNEAAVLYDELNILNSENDRIKAEIESKTALNKVDEIAVEKLGLKKLDKTQIQYIDVRNEDVTKVVEKESNNVFLKIKDWFIGLKEYIGI